MGDQPPSAIGRQMGTLIAPTNAFNDRGLVVRDLYWVQRLFDARVRILIGRGDPSDYVGATWMQNVNNSFVNRSFGEPRRPFSWARPEARCLDPPNRPFLCHRWRKQRLQPDHQG